MPLVRLQKVLAEAGIASRRKAEDLIRDGRVTVNGEVIRTLGERVDPSRDRIRVNGRPIPPLPEKVYYLLYKPPGVITSLKDPEGRPTIKELTPGIKTKVFPVGRLDYDAEGLLLLTNDGEVAMRLAHPRYQVARTYLVKVKGVLSRADMKRLVDGIPLDDGMSPPMQVIPLKMLRKNSWLQVVVHEGRNRVIKRTFAAIHHPVLRLKRIGFGPLTIAGMRPGACRALLPEEIEKLKGLL